MSQKYYQIFNKKTVVQTKVKSYICNINQMFGYKIILAWSLVLLKKEKTHRIEELFLLQKS